MVGVKSVSYVLNISTSTYFMVILSKYKTFISPNKINNIGPKQTEYI